MYYWRSVAAAAAAAAVAAVTTTTTTTTTVWLNASFSRINYNDFLFSLWQRSPSYTATAVKRDSEPVVYISCFENKVSGLNFAESALCLRTGSSPGCVYMYKNRMCCAYRKKKHREERQSEEKKKSKINNGNKECECVYKYE